MPKFKDYPAAARFDAGDILLKDGTAGTKKILVVDAATEFAGMVSAINHRNVYRGRNLGSTVTAEQKAAIQNGTFDNLFVGDYWSINGVNWAVADMDYWLNSGTPFFTQHHLVIIPKQPLYIDKMNKTDTTEGGYALSHMRTEGLNQAKEMARAAFGDMVLTHREYLINAVTNGYSSGGAWYDSDVELMNEIMKYGCYIHMSANNGVTFQYRHTIDKQQLAVFCFSCNDIGTPNSIWLRDVVSDNSFASFGSQNDARRDTASTIRYILPVFPIG